MSHDREEEFAFLESMIYAKRQSMTQYALSAMDPTEVDEIYWMWALCRERDAEHKNQDTGKWLVFVDPCRINSTWVAIKKATEEGRLGFGSKCATKLSFSKKGGGKQYVICVYTKDYKDMEDITRVREELRAMAIGGKIPYKTDDMTERKISGSKYYF